jgi:hypothetical protein
MESIALTAVTATPTNNSAGSKTKSAAECRYGEDDDDDDDIAASISYDRIVKV